MTLGLVLAFGLALGWIPLYVFRTEAWSVSLQHYSGVERRSVQWTPVVFAVHVTLGACCVALIVRAAQEERRLHAQLGSVYAEYCRSVKRLIPFVW